MICQILRLLKCCVYRLKGKTLLLSLLECSRQRKCECKRCFGFNVAKVLFRIRLVQNKAKGASAIFQRHQKFCKTLRLFLYNFAFVEGLRLSAERQKLLLTLLGCSRQRKCECKRCFGFNVAKVLFRIRLVQNKAKGASAIFQRHQKFCKTLRLFLYNFAFVEGLRLSAERQNFA